jgi:DNA (cytosine-5)-methyltransferase 1
MNHLDLFSGIGGFSLGLEKAGFTTKAFCEMDPFCKLVLNKHWKDIPIYDNIKTLNGTQIEKDIGAIDIITGGFPCQPYSVAGKQKGTNDDRYLWPEMFRVIREVQPTFVIAENVKGLVNIQDGMVFETVCSDLESEGFEVQTFIIPAAGIGAPHKRERVWIVAYSDSNRHSNKIRGSSTKEERISQEHRQDHNTTRKSSGASSVWETNNQHVPNSSGKRSSSQSIGVNRELAEESSGEKKTRNKSTLCTSSLCSDVSNSNTRFSDGSQEEIQSRRSSRDEYVENSRRTLRQGSQFGTENENEIRKENANQSERSSKTREDVVADTYTRFSNGSQEEIVEGGTPLTLAVKIWPTPRANKVIPRITDKNREKLANRNKSNLEEEVAGYCGQATGSLNPMWVEWLMGYPAEHTDLKHWEMLSSRKSRKKSVKQS